MNTATIVEKLDRYVRRDDYAGYDPYDALNSPLLRACCLGMKYPRIMAIQLLKRLPLNVRPLLGIKKGHNPKALGLLLWGYAKLYRLSGDSAYLDRIQHLLKLLRASRSTGYSGHCWGYNFDWQNLAFFIPKFTPTIVNSSMIGHALLDAYRYTGDEDALAMALPIKDFILRDLNRTQWNDTFCFSYTPLDHTPVHNANMLGASLLIRLSRYCVDDELPAAALSSLAYTMRHQRPDGSWYYADTAIQKWIDSFHTGFNLQALWYFLREGCAEKYEPAFWKGVEFYADRFFLPDGTPRYYHDRTYPIDIHAPAQAIVLLSLLSGEPYEELARRVASWMVANMYDRNRGCFFFQKGKLFTNRVSYIRWSQAWSFHALSSLLLAQSQKQADRNELSCESGSTSATRPMCHSFSA